MNDKIHLQPRPLSQLERIGGDGLGRWRAYGGDPAFDCLDGGQVLGGGWYLLDFEVEVHRGSVHMPCAYPDYCNGYFLEGDSIALPLGHAREGVHRRAAVVRFSRDVSRLRFDPTVLPSDFTLRALDLRRIGRLEAAKSMLGGLLVRKSPWAGVKLCARMLADLLSGGARRMAERMYGEYSAKPEPGDLSDYALWMDYYDDRSDTALALARESVGQLAGTPLISVVVPVYNTDERWLRACIESVRGQVYPHWELCIADDASTRAHVRAVLGEYAAADERIKFVSREVNGHISAASNSALGIATGQYVALLDHDDELHPLALLECARALVANPQWRLLYTDEDKIDERGVRSDPYFKSDWNPDLLLSQNCVCHLSVYARDAVEAVGGFRLGCEGAQDWDLTLRIAETLAPGEIGHVPKVLYHWRMIEGSTALGPGEKNYAHEAGAKVIQEHLDRTGQPARVEGLPGFSGYYRVFRELSPEPLVSLLVPTRDHVDLVKQCVDSILDKTDYDNLEIIIIDNGSTDPATLAYFRSLAGHPKVRVERYDQPFNFSALNNFGARHARGEVLGLINNDIEVISPHWLREMAGHAMRPGVGAVGAMLYYPNDTIQHAGVVLGIGGVAGHSYVGYWKGYPGNKHRAGLAQNISAVTGACMLVRASVYAEVGGLDEALVVAFNDIDFCLRVREAGYRNVWTPFAELYHHESATRGYEDTPEKVRRFKGEERFMQERWGRLLQEDPYYSPNFSIDLAPFSLSFPPRAWPPLAEGDGHAAEALHAAPEATHHA